MPFLNHRDLLVFKSVLDHRSFSRAAEATFLTQPAVSQAVRRLEASLGTQLLTRVRPPSPTPAGARLYTHAADILARDERARRDLDDIRHGGGGTLRLGASQALSRELLPRLVRRFHAARPRASLHFETLPSRDLVRTVADGRLELGLGPLQKSMPGFARHPLARQRMVLYAARGSASHVALKKRGAEALHDVPLVTSSLDAPGARPGGGKLRDRFRTVWEIHSLDLRVEVVRAGLAAGYLPDSVVRAAGHRRDFVPVDWLDFGVIVRDAGLFHLEKEPLTDLAAEFLRLAKIGPA